MMFAGTPGELESVAAPRKEMNDTCIFQHIEDISTSRQKHSFGIEDSWQLASLTGINGVCLTNKESIGPVACSWTHFLCDK